MLDAAVEALWGLATTTVQREALTEIRKTRTYMDKDEYASRVSDYVVGYACKGEISATGAVDVFEKLLASENVAASSSFKSVALKAQMQVLKNRQVAAAEAVFTCQGLEHFRSTRSFVRISAPGHRKVKLPGTTMPGAR